MRRDNDDGSRALRGVQAQDLWHASLEGSDDFLVAWVAEDGHGTAAVGEGYDGAASAVCCAHCCEGDGLLLQGHWG